MGRYENLFIFFFLKAIQIGGSAQRKTVSVGLVETRAFFLGLCYFDQIETGLEIFNDKNAKLRLVLRI